ncbi:MAG: plastocyanin/azurin family copper-binding protein [Alphaproteobacteria bacterium]|nr:plastocyanin/azurin family copper-binding protein [Alphaproteobacteria bacterium]
MSRHALLPALLLLGVAVAAEASVSNIDQAGQQFSKKSLGVHVGDSIRYKNSDDAIHNINVIDAADLARDMGLQKPGENIDVLFDKAGKFIVRCSIHPKMKMIVTAE